MPPASTAFARSEAACPHSLNPYGYGQASWLHHTLARQNYCPAGTPQNLQWLETPLWQTGSQWMLGADAGDPMTYASSATNYVFTYGNLTPLDDRPWSYTPTSRVGDRA